jgi:hypothetical protein
MACWPVPMTTYDGKQYFFSDDVYQHEFSLNGTWVVRMRKDPFIHDEFHKAFALGYTYTPSPTHTFMNTPIAKFERVIDMNWTQRYGIPRFTSEHNSHIFMKYSSRILQTLNDTDQSKLGNCITLRDQFRVNVPPQHLDAVLAVAARLYPNLDSTIYEIITQSYQRLIKWSGRDVCDLISRSHSLGSVVSDYDFIRPGPPLWVNNFVFR